MQSRTFHPLVVDSAIFKGLEYEVFAVVNPINESFFAIVFCNSHNFFGECNGYGLGLSDSHSLKKLFNVKYPFTLGWKDDSFFVKTGDVVYLVNSTKVF